MFIGRPVILSEVKKAPIETWSLLALSLSKRLVEMPVYRDPVDIRATSAWPWGRKRAVYKARDTYKYARVNRCRRRSFVGLTPSRTGLGRQGLLRMTFLANVWTKHLADAQCKARHSERSEESPVFSIGPGPHALRGRTCARTHRRPGG